MTDPKCFEGLWAKSDAGGQPHSLVGHLFDAGAVAELIWDRFLSSHLKNRLNFASDGYGRQLLVLLSCWHDLGKATPAFQMKAHTIKPNSSEPIAISECDRLRRTLLDGIADCSLDLPKHETSEFKHWHHPKASCVIARRTLEKFEHVDIEWLEAILEGHHGLFGHVKNAPRRAPGSPLGDATWELAQDALAGFLIDQFELHLDQWSLEIPDRGTQLALAGFVVMADWIASSDLFPGLGLINPTLATCRDRASRAWKELGFHSGWSQGEKTKTFAQRFSFSPRPLQHLVASAAEQQPGLMIVEAPMGEGKTEAAEWAMEILAQRLGLSGGIIAMPTQGTTDAMYERVCAWSLDVDPTAPVALLHGKNMLNEKWREALQTTQVTGVFDEDLDEYGMPRFYGESVSTKQVAPGPSSWILGRYRGFLSTISVATVDQLLWAGTRTKFVSLRYAGLSGRVVVIDEVHAYDVYMSVFLKEVLRWCAMLGVPVILMSATLPPLVRRDLVAAWRDCDNDEDMDVAEPAGYPSVLSVWPDRSEVTTCQPFRTDLDVKVSVLPTDDPDDVAPISSAIVDSVAAGGCALAIFNTVSRAQEVYQAIKERGIDCLLINGRLTATERAQRTEHALQLYGKDPTHRPAKFVVIATQIAEQSFDADADILFTDVAPIDLLLQRIGRLHRHDRPLTDRPAKLRQPQTIVTGLSLHGTHPAWAGAFALPAEAPPPKPEKAAKTVYRPGALLATAALVQQPVTWSIPSSVPDLVRRGYQSQWEGPHEWQSAYESAYLHELAEAGYREERAKIHRLDSRRSRSDDLYKLHEMSSSGEDASRPLVRDGDNTLEVCLVVQTPDGFFTLDGTPLGHNGERVADVKIARKVLGDSVRLRQGHDLNQVDPLPQWASLHLLQDMPVVVLNQALTGKADEKEIRYDVELGLIL